MIIRHLKDMDDQGRTIDTDNWTSRRLLLKNDGMGFSLHDTVIKAGTTTKMCYRNHLEAVYCIAGAGQLKNLETGETHPIQVGTMYALDQHDLHELTGFTDMRMVCVFNPPVTGDEVHDETGAYPAHA